MTQAVQEKASTSKTAAAAQEVPTRMRGLRIPSDEAYVIAGHPVFFIDDHAPTDALFSAALCRASRLQELINVVQCSSSGLEIGPSEVAALLDPLAREVVAILEALGERPGVRS